MIPPRLFPALVLAAAVAASGPVLAAEPEAVATAAAADAPPSVAEQIDNYLKTSPAVLPKDGASGVTAGSEEPRKVHGVVDVSVGTGGYRSAYVRSDIPVGKTGTVSIAVEDTRYGNRSGRFAEYGRQSLGLGLRFDGAALDPAGCRRRQAGEDAPDLRFDPRVDGQHLQSCPSADAPRYPQ